jgi:hypothetical protein
MRQSPPNETIPAVAEPGRIHIVVDVVIRPSVENMDHRPAGRRWLGVVPFAALGVLGVVRLAAGGQSNIGVGSALLVVAVVASAALVGVPMINRSAARNATVFISGDRVGMTNFRGRQRSFKIDQLASVTLRSVTVGGSTTAYSIFVGRDGRCLFRVASRQWSLVDLGQVCDAAGVPLLGSWGEMSTPRQVNKEIPGTFPRLVGG